jgi:SAM-dependent methyltransferase
VDWNSAEAQRLRFPQLLRVCQGEADFSLLDFGCGYGALADYLREHGHSCRYVGFDISPDMIAAARALHAGEPDCAFVCDEGLLEPADFAVSSGVFHVKLATPVTVWQEYVFHQIDRIAALSRRGFAFNLLTSYADAERMRDDLYYANPCTFFDLCKRKYARNVALLHDYGAYEFTILVRL